MAEKTLQTRIALKYDTYAKWNKWFLKSNPSTEVPAPDFKADGFNFDLYEDKGAALTLKKGEIGLVEIPTGSSEATTAPTVLFKVGDGTHRFCELSWASALAADVYSWAKAETVALAPKTEKQTIDGVEREVETGHKLVFKTGTNIIHDVDLSSFATDAELGELTEELAAHMDAANPHGITKATVGLSNVDNKSTAEIKSEFTGSVASGNTGFVTGGAVHTAVEGAKSHADDLISTLTTSGAVHANTEAIASLLDAVGNAEETTIETDADGKETTKVTKAAKGLYKLIDDGDKALSDRLAPIEAFFEAADHDGEDETNGLYDALDTLKEIQEYLKGDGSAAGDVVSKIAALEDEFEEGGRVADAEDAIGTLSESLADSQADLADLLSITKSFLHKTDGKVIENVIYTAVTGATDAAVTADTKAQGALDILNGATTDDIGLIGQVTALAATVNGTGTGTTRVDGLVDKVDANAQAIADIQSDYVSTDGTKLMFGNDTIIFNCGDSGVA